MPAKGRTRILPLPEHPVGIVHKDTRPWRASAWRSGEVMQHSAFIARLMGPVLLINGLAILINRRGFQDMIAGAVRNPSVVYLTGLLTLLAGLVVVEFHNVWVLGWPVLITIVGWLGIAGGIARILFPASMAEFGERMVTRDSLMVGGAIVSLLLGGILSIKGYGFAP
jgi:hypothetical protein